MVDLLQDIQPHAPMTARTHAPPARTMRTPRAGGETAGATTDPSPSPRQDLSQIKATLAEASACVASLRARRYGDHRKVLPI